MSTCTYHDLLAAAAVRINALDGTDAVALQNTYSARPLTDANFISSIFPLNAIRDAILNAEQRLATAIGDVGNHPWRSFIISETDPLTSGDVMPSVDKNGIGIIGIYGNVLDGNNPALVCTEPDDQELEMIRRWQLAPQLWIMPLYNYALDGNGITHTRTTVTVQVCVYDYATQQAAFDADDTILLPDVLAPAYISGALAGLVRDDEFVQQAALYAQYFNATEQTIRSGLTSAAQIALPGPALNVASA